MASVYHSSAKHTHQVSQIQAAFFLPADIFSNRKTTIKKHSKQTKGKKRDTLYRYWTHQKEKCQKWSIRKCMMEPTYQQTVSDNLHSSELWCKIGRISLGCITADFICLTTQNLSCVAKKGVTKQTSFAAPGRTRERQSRSSQSFLVEQNFESGRNQCH